MEPNISGYCEWLNRELEQLNAYHNHKEVMAWTATALFLGAVGALVASPPDIALARPLFSLGITLSVAMLVGWFTNMQFRMRWHSADTVVAVRRALARLYANNQTGFNEEDINPTTDWVLGGLPEFVAAEARIVRSQVTRRWFPITSIEFKDPRWHTEIASYLLIVLATFTAGLAITTGLSNRIESEQIMLEIHSLSDKMANLTSVSDVSFTLAERLSRLEQLDLEARLVRMKNEMDDLRNLSSKSITTPSKSLQPTRPQKLNEPRR